MPALSIFDKFGGASAIVAGNLVPPIKTRGIPHVFAAPAGPVSPRRAGLAGGSTIYRCLCSFESEFLSVCVAHQLLECRLGSEDVLVVTA